MTRHWFRCAAAAIAFVLVALLPRPAAAQTLPLTLRLSGSGGRVSVVGTGGGLCDLSTTNTSCVFQIATGAAVRVSANVPFGQVPGLLSGGTGPAAGCGFSACSFTMTAAAELSAGFSTGNGTIATLTTTLTGDGKGTVSADDSRCQNVDPAQGNGCATNYLQGSPVSIGAAAAPGSRFSAYSAGTGGAAGCGSAAQCDFTITGTATVTASFRALSSLAISPSSAMKPVGGPGQTFTAMGTYTDGVTESVGPGMGAWITVASLPAARHALGAAIAGGRIYAVGGDQDGAPTSAVTSYDPATNTWTTRASMGTAREGPGVAESGGYIYAIGGNTTGSTPVAVVERYDPVANAWTPRAPLPAARRFLAAATINGIIYAVGGDTTSGGGSTVVGTLEAYDPATDTWTAKTPMPTPRRYLATAVADGLLYAIGGDANGPLATVETYDPATNTWTSKASMPGALAATAAASVDGAIYVVGGGTALFSAYAYDPAQNAWSIKTNMPTGRLELAAAALNGVVYAIGGITGSEGNSRVDKVESFVESVRWSSSAPAIARITQQGTATAVAPGTASISVIAGTTTCGATCATFTAFTSFPTDMALEAPANNSVMTAGASFAITGWALNKGAPTGTGVDTVHVYAVPSSGAAIFIGAATYGLARSDIGAIYGSQFTNSGFTLTAGASLSAGAYTIVAYAHNALTGNFDALKTANIQLKAAVSNPFMSVDTPRPSQVVTSSFEVGGWALDAGAPAGTGVDAVVFYVFPNDGAAPGVYVGQGSYGAPRADLGALFGQQFTNCGFHFTVSGLGPGAYMLAAIAHSTVTGSYSIVRTVHFTVNATALMSVDLPSPEAVIAGNLVTVAGWSIDRAVESTGGSGTGVDTIHVYAFPNPGSGQAAIFLGVATLGVGRPDVGGIYGTRYDTSGYTLTVDRVSVGLTAGAYNLVAVSHSAVTNTFNNVALVRVTLQ